MRLKENWAVVKGRNDHLLYILMIMMMMMMMVMKRRKRIQMFQSTVKRSSSLCQMTATQNEFNIIKLERWASQRR